MIVEIYFVLYSSKAKIAVFDFLKPILAVKVQVQSWTRVGNTEKKRRAYFRQTVKVIR